MQICLDELEDEIQIAAVEGLDDFVQFYYVFVVHLM